MFEIVAMVFILAGLGFSFYLQYRTAKNYAEIRDMLKQIEKYEDGDS